MAVINWWEEDVVVGKRAAEAMPEEEEVVEVVNRDMGFTQRKVGENRGDSDPVPTTSKRCERRGSSPEIGMTVICARRTRWRQKERRKRRWWRFGTGAWEFNQKRANESRVSTAGGSSPES